MCSPLASEDKERIAVPLWMLGNTALNITETNDNKKGKGKGKTATLTLPGLRFAPITTSASAAASIASSIHPSRSSSATSSLAATATTSISSAATSIASSIASSHSSAATSSLTSTTAGKAPNVNQAYDRHPPTSPPSGAKVVNPPRKRRLSNDSDDVSTDDDDESLQLTDSSDVDERMKRRTYGALPETMSPIACRLNEHEDVELMLSNDMWVLERDMQALRARKILEGRRGRAEFAGVPLFYPPAPTSPKPSVATRTMYRRRSKDSIRSMYVFRSSAR